MDLHKAILIILEDRVGRDNRISRTNLLGAVRGEVDILVSDREMRNAIKDMREQGCLICSTSADGGGYWMAGHPGEAKDMKLDYRKRALSCLMTAGKIEKSARARFGDQMTLDLETG